MINTGIILSLRWDDPPKPACTVIIKNGFDSDVVKLIDATKKVIDDYHIGGVAHLMRVIELQAELLGLDVVVLDEATTFVTKVI